MLKSDRVSFYGSIVLVVAGVVFCKCDFTISVPPSSTIFSPYYNQSYKNNINCTWQIKTAPGNKIILRLEDLDIEPDEPRMCGFRPCCKHNWLSVPVSNSIPLKTQQLCGSRVPQEFREIQVQAPEITVKMHITRVTKGAKGFRMSVTTGVPDCLVPGMVPCGLSVSDRCYNNMTERCNSVSDCPNGQDEIGCHIQCVSAEGQFLLSQKCDGHPDCSDFSDEIDCGFCPEGKVQCSAGSKHCFNAIRGRCNGRFDCPQGEDEAGCLPECKGRIACSSGEGCYSPWQHCDTLSDCSDGSDETQCPQELCSPLQDRRLCHNSRCLPIAMWCDGNDDCGDNSDEAVCFKNSMVALAIMSCLLCGLLLVVAVSCALRIYGHRFQSMSTYHQHITSRHISHHRMSTSVSLPTLLDDEFFLREPPPAYSVAVGQSPSRTQRQRRSRPRPVPTPQVMIKPPEYHEVSSSQSTPIRNSTTSSATDDTLLLSS